MSAFADITEYLHPLTLPINGKSYVVPALPYDTGVRFTSNVSTDTISAMTEEEFHRTFLGSALDEMRADGVPLLYVARAALTALADFQGGRDVAEVMWKTGGDPKAIQALLPSKPPASKPSRATGGATTTKRPASSRATTSQPKS